MMPPERNDQTTSHAATAPAIVVASGTLSSRSLRLRSTAANPMIDGTNVVPSPVACERYSCHQSVVDGLGRFGDAAGADLRREHAAERERQRHRDQQGQRERTGKHRAGSRRATHALDKSRSGAHGQTKNP